jgi:alkylation response protein AidB-like acyl-CoA dehydrogenase
MATFFARPYSDRTTISEQRAGAWLIGGDGPARGDDAGELTDEHRLIAPDGGEFATQEVLPALERLEQKDWALNRELLRRAASSGCSAPTCRRYGGVDLDKVATLIVSEQGRATPSFGATFGAQANLTILPIYMFGTDAQKQRYLPRS